MKTKNVPLWVLNGYEYKIAELKTTVQALRKAGLFALIPEHVVMIESLEHTLKGLKDQIQALNN